MLASATTDDRILGCIDRGMATLGTQLNQVIYFHLERTWGISRAQLPNAPGKLMEGLKMMFGPGSKVVEAGILREVRNSFGIASTVTNLREAIELARQTS